MRISQDDNLINVLVIDDDETIQRVMSSYLKKYFNDLNLLHYIEVCDDAMGCLFSLNDHGSRYDIIFLDYHMPGVDGIGIYNSIHMTQPQLKTHLIFLTSTVDDLKSQMNAEDIDTENLSFLSKPFDYDTFQEHVSGILLADHK